MLSLMLTLAGLTAFTREAAAQEATDPQINAQLYHFPIDARYTLWSEDSEIGEPYTVSARLGLIYTQRPFVFVREFGGEEVEARTILEDSIQTDVIGGISTGRLRIGVDVPLFLDTNGTGFDGGGGLGDLGLDLKLGLARQSDDNPVGFALGIRFDFPTATVPAPVYSEGVSFEILAMVDHTTGKTHLVGNVGHRHVPGVQLADVSWDEQLVFRAGIGQELADDFGVSADLAGHLDYSSLFQNHDGEPMELLLGGWAGLFEDVVLRGGVGFGLIDAVGAPTVRGVALLSYEPKAKEPGPEPEADVAVRLEIQDSKTGELIDTVKTEVVLDEGREYGGPVVNFKVHPGTYSVMATADGYRDLDDTFDVPAVEGLHEVVKKMDAMLGTVKVIVRDTDDNRLPATVTVGGTDEHPAPQGETEFQAKPGGLSIEADSDGYRPATVAIEVEAGQTQTVLIQLERSLVTPTEGPKLELFENVHFDFDSDVIQARSYPLLRDAARVIKHSENRGRIRVEGHTDTVGSRVYNIDLSQRRSQAVFRYLVETEGVPANRLERIGCGEDYNIEPLGDNVKSEANRRVDFIWVDQQPTPCVVERR